MTEPTAPFPIRRYLKGRVTELEDLVVVLSPPLPKGDLGGFKGGI